MKAILLDGDFFYTKEAIVENQVKVVSQDYVKISYFFSKKYCDRYRYFTNVDEGEAPSVVVWDEERGLYLGYYNRAGEFKEKNPQSWNKRMSYGAEFFFERMGLNIKGSVHYKELVAHEDVKEVEIYVNDRDEDLLDLLFERTYRLLEPDFKLYGVAEREANKMVLQFYKNPKFVTYETLVIATADYIDKVEKMDGNQNELRLEVQEHTMHVDVLAQIDEEWEKIGVLPLDFAAQIGPAIREGRKVVIKNLGKEWIDREDRILIGDEKYDVYYQEWVVRIYLSWGQ
ncbi:TPA: hypothetical protein ROY42_005637 [Bacillus thuringiensis]|nr:hypothetical protein [Bacillus thuringiensis]